MFVTLEKNTAFPEPFPKGALLLIDKPFSWSSFDVVNKVRYLLAQRLGLKPKKFKVGHAGTLDPLATGLLLLCIGDYTKRIEQLQATSKTYTGVFTFGATTPSFDLEKAVDATFPTDHLTDALIQQALPDFLGDIQQVPPVFSAIKVDGERLYKNARTGETVAMPFRTVHIDAFNVGLLRATPPSEGQKPGVISKKGAEIMLHPDYAAGLQADFEVVCGKGTYIRSLAHDLGQAVGTGAYLSSLRRTASGAFSVADAWTMDAFESWVRAME
jgi:tRNA pseudouridine55 synthase